MWCAQCGQQLKELDHGATVRCCGGYAYWYPQPPLPSDGWWPVVVKQGVFDYKDGFATIWFERIYLYCSTDMKKFNPKNAVLPNEVQ